MAGAKGSNWIWQAYLALSARGGMPEAKGREILKQTFPTVAHLVDDIVTAKGDDSKIDGRKLELMYEEQAGEMAALDSHSLTNRVRAAVNSGNRVAITDKESYPSFNSKIRETAGSSRIFQTGE